NTLPIHHQKRKTADDRQPSTPTLGQIIYTAFIQPRPLSVLLEVQRHPKPLKVMTQMVASSCLGRMLFYWESLDVLEKEGLTIPM
ncbi:hypothetical protein ACQP3L_36975, partial [Escherichia coli]